MRRVGTDERMRLVAETANAFTACTGNLNELLATVARRTSEILDSYCAVSLVSDDGLLMRPIALHDSDPATVTELRRVLSAPYVLDGSSLAAMLHTGELVESEGMSPELLQARFPDPHDQALVARLGLRHIVFVPLRARAALLGMIALVRHGSKAESFSAEDKATARSLADLAALAIANAQLLQATRAQADERRQLNQQLGRLNEHAREFAAATAEPQRLYDAIARIVREQNGEIGIVRLVSADHEWVECVGSVSHSDPEIAEAIRRVMFGQRLRVADWIAGSVVTTATPKRVGPVPTETLRAAFPPAFHSIFDVVQPTTIMVVPLVSHDGVVGVAGVIRRGPAFSDDELALHERIAAHAAEAVSNARLLEQRNRELANRQRVVGHQRLLSELSRQFAAATGDLDLLLDTVASRLQDVVGDGCVIRVLTPDGSAFTERSWAALPPEMLARRKGGEPPQPIVGKGVAGTVAISGQTILVREFGEQTLAMVPPEQREYVAQLGIQSMLACPLRVHGRVAGVITMLRTHAGQPYAQEDRRLVEDIATHAGLALSNSRLLLERSREVAERERLADRLRQVSGLAREFAAATSDIRSLKELIARRISDLFGELCVVRTLDPDTKQFDHDGACFHPDPTLHALASRTLVLTPLRYGEGVSGRVAATGQSMRVALRTEDIAAMTDEGFKGFIRAMGMTSLICVPLVVSGRIAGVVSVARGAGSEQFTDADVASVEDLAAHASLAIGNSQMLAAAKAELVERVRQEEVLRRGFLEAAPDAVLIIDARERITLVNSRAEHLFGYSRDELVLMTFGDLVPPAAPRDLMGVRKDRTRFAAEVTQSPIESPDGTLVATAVRDVTERRREYEERNRRMQEASRLKSEFLANMSHELRTPLNAIIGFTSLIHAGKAGAVSDIHREYLGDILSSSRHLLQLINDVLDLSKVEAGRLDVNVERVDLVQLTAEVQAIVRGLLAENRVKLSVQIPSDIGEVVLDPRLLKQVLYNYLSNAIKFTPEGGRVTLKISALDATNVAIEVIDTGIGIKEADLGRLFTEFQQLDQGAHVHKGTGLGLALTKRIVEAQGGSVSVESALGVGSTFRATLPRRPREGRVQG